MRHKLPDSARAVVPSEGRVARKADNSGAIRLKTPLNLWLNSRWYSLCLERFKSIATTMGYKNLTENAIRPDKLMSRSFELLEEDTQRLMKDRHQFIQVPCPACGSVNQVPFCEKRGMEFVACSECETVFGSPRPDEARLAKYYREATYYEYWNKFIYPASEEARREQIVKPRVKRILDIAERFNLKCGKLIEVGAGTGQFCEEMVKKKHFQEVVAIEPTPSSAESSRKRGLKVIEKPVEEVPLEDGGADMIVSFEVLEHLFSPKDYLNSCKRLTKEGGTVIVTCPNVKGFDVNLLREVSDTITPEHLNLFHPASLKRLFESVGLEVLQLMTPGRLDAEIVRKKTLAGKFDLSAKPELKRILLDDWEQEGQAFQDSLEKSLQSSHMWIVARKGAS